MTRPARSVKKKLPVSEHSKHCMIHSYGGYGCDCIVSRRIERIHRLAMEWAKARCRAMECKLVFSGLDYYAAHDAERTAREKLLTACIRELGNSRPSRAEKNRKAKR